VTSTASPQLKIRVLAFARRSQVLNLFDCGCLPIRVRVRVVCLNQTDMIKKKFIAAGSSKLTGFEQNPDFRGGPILIVCEDLDNQRDFVRRIAFKNNVVKNQLFIADSRSLFYGAFDHVAGNARLAGLFACSEQPRIARGVGSTKLRSDDDLFHQFSDNLAFS